MLRDGHVKNRITSFRAAWSSMSKRSNRWKLAGGSFSVGANCGDAGGNRHLSSVVFDRGRCSRKNVADGRFTSAMVVKIGFPRGGCERDRVLQRESPI